MITFSVSEILKLHVLAGIGAFVFTTMGSMLLKCLISKRRQKAKDMKFKNEVKEIVEKKHKGCND